MKENVEKVNVNQTKQPVDMSMKGSSSDPGAIF